MAKRAKPLQLPILAKGFRIDPDTPTLIRFQHPSSGRFEIDVASPHALTEDTIEIGADAAVNTPIHFTVSRIGATGGVTPASVRSLKVEIVSGKRRHLEKIILNAGSQVLRYFLNYSEPQPGMVLCPWHGYQRAKRGRCPFGDYPPS